MQCTAFSHGCRLSSSPAESWLDVRCDEWSEDIDALGPVRPDTPTVSIGPSSASRASPQMPRTESLVNVEAMVSAAGEAAALDILPELAPEGTQGAYFVTGASGDRVGVFKPADEEVCGEANPRGLNTEAAVLKTSVPAGEGWRREVAAYRLDYGHFAGVPETVELSMPQSLFPRAGRRKRGSFQRYVRSDGESWDVAPGRLPAAAVQRIAILDIRLCNSDRHGGNILFRRGADGAIAELVPIDHAACAPTHLAEVELEWLSWPQSKLPFTDDALEYIRGLDAAADAAVLTGECGLCADAADNVRAATTLLQRGAAAGLTARAIGEMLRRPTLSEPSVLEAAMAGSRGTSGDIDFGELRTAIDEAVAEEVARRM
eukprot:TRINITY_DN2628_c0_g1_i1.p1 TRINITY_DN2628_c0_g1~~TRINITY_DN2628_c0_g1_i1.p1  ORF type:complete len:374 (+),score=140.80 TRINITY_DN2628_c0_g1_i1:754-1875(+)